MHVLKVDVLPSNYNFFLLVYATVDLVEVHELGHLERQLHYCCFDGGGATRIVQIVSQHPVLVNFSLFDKRVGKRP